MKRRDLRAHVLFWFGPACVGGLFLVLLGMLGCAHQQTRLQADDETEHDRYGVRTVGDVSSVGNVQPVQVGGVGLVIGLEGTGGPTPPDGYRTMLEEDLRKQGVKNVKKVLSDPNNAVVTVTGLIQPGTGKDEPIDVEVTLAPGSRATSLRGGYLLRCILYNYDFTRHLRPEYDGPNNMLRGHPVAHVEGPILVGASVGERDEATRLKHGNIWGGGRCHIIQPFTLMMNPDQQFARVTSTVADRINETFYGIIHGNPDTSVATAQANLAVVLKVPSQYHLNQPRYLRVIRLIPIQRTYDASVKKDGKEHRTYRQRLAEDLLDPSRTVTAALRLEALGEKSIPILKEGMKSKYPLVRFCSAEALAYLGNPSSGDELALAVAQQPMLRAFALTALASLDEAVSQVKLQDLLNQSDDDETRYGAFRALRTLDARNPMVRGELLNDSFWLHEVAPGTTPLVHVSSRKRAEIVLFGDDITLKPPFSLLAGDFTIRATGDDTHCIISRTPLRSAALPPRQCSLKLQTILKTLTHMGGTYSEALALLRQAEKSQSLSCRMRCDALPQFVTAYDLVALGSGKAGKRKDNDESLLAGQDMGVTPTLYDLGAPAPLTQALEHEAAQTRSQFRPRPEGKTAARSLEGNE